MSEKSKLMADAWRDLPTEEKDQYCVQEVEGSDGDEGEEVSPNQLAIRVAKRHQGDVSTSLAWVYLLIA